MQQAWRVIGILGFTQIMSWGALYYAFGVLAPAIRQALGLPSELIYGAFSWAILVAGLAATPVGMAIDRIGGRYVMAAGSLACGGGLMWLGHCDGAGAYFGAWTLLGLGMALSLYEAAFATINRKADDGGRQAISTLTLFGGFASTIFWPLTAQLNAALGWRQTYLCYAAVQLLLCLPLHLLLGKDGARQRLTAVNGAARAHTLGEALRHPAFWTLAGAFAANALIFSALSVHLLPLIQDFGHAASLAVLLLTLIGPMQVVGRLLERLWAHRVTPQLVGQLTFATLPAAILVLLLFGSQAWAVSLFCVLYGLSNGVLTILRGTLPQALFGREHYGAISGAMAGPALLAKAAGPLAAAMVLRAHGEPTLLLWGLLAIAGGALLLYWHAHGQRASAAGVAEGLQARAGWPSS
ncbi:MFS transporter [Oxalobacteraceae bacterium]|nr:MFS transporter [Oxalobacteraceae bacterium]